MYIHNKQLSRRFFVLISHELKRAKTHFSFTALQLFTKHYYLDF